MASGLAGDVPRQMQRLVAAGPAGGLTDAQLLERFATRRDAAAEVAFEALVTRHGPMVFRACRALVRDPRDAEDAFQATFLVLARKADRVGARGPLGPWLHGVARRVSLKARAASARKARREGGLASDPPAPADLAPCPDLAPTLHEELGRLPDKYRRPVVLCHLEGLTHAEAAQELGWPVGTVSVRLARARDLLRQRLSRRGFAPDPSTFGPALLAGATPSVETLIRIASAALPSAVGMASAGALAYGKGSTSMTLTSLMKWLAIPLALSVGAAGGVAATRWSHQKKTVAAQPDEEPPLPPDFFVLPVADPKDGPVPEPVKVGQIFNIEVLEALPGRPITGERVVRPDGTISLGFYGDIRVVGLDRNQIKVRLIEHLRNYINDEVLGLSRLDVKTKKVEFVKPVDSGRVFVDDSVIPPSKGSASHPESNPPDPFHEYYNFGRPNSVDENLRVRVEALERELKELRDSRKGSEAAMPGPK